MRDSLHTLIYAVVLGVVCAALLTGANRTLAARQKANEEADNLRSVLAVLGVKVAKDASSEELLETFHKSVHKTKVGGRDGFEKGKENGPVALEFKGPGLWGEITGYLALEPDRRTIRGIAFPKQEETPGLGGDIKEPWFRKRFVGKRIVGEGGVAGLHLVPPGEAEGANEVDAITGATLTCRKVESMLNLAIGQVVNGGGPHGGQ